MREAIGRLLGLPAPAKAATGPGVYSLSTYAPVLSQSQVPQKLMAEAQALFHNQTWVAACERAIVGRYVRALWHLEQADGDTVDKAASPAEQAVLDLLERPSPTRTRRQLWSLTLRHMGLCGNAFWYQDSRDLLQGTPLSLLYINPARMSVVEDEAGNLLGWVMDKADNPMTRVGAQAVPFRAEEIVHFTLDEPDWGHWGIGIAEAAYAKLTIERLADSHTQQVLASGGRIPGLLAPKQGTTVMNQEQWEATVRDYRNIVGDPEAAKRMHIVRGPVDFTETASNPQELQLKELSEASKENILASWGVPASQLGIMQARGLNSGETVKYEEAALWQGAIESRGSAFEEKVQAIVDSFGLGLKMVVDKPAFDDQAPLFENAERSKIIPLTVNERRALIGLDPLEDEEIGTAIFIDKSMVRIDEEPEPEPVNLPPPPFEEPIEEALPKATLDSLHGVGERLRKATEPALRQAVQALLAKQRESIARLVTRHYEVIARKPNDHTPWWRGFDAAWAEQVEPVIDQLARKTVNSVERGLAQPKADLDFIDQIRAYLRGAVLARARGIDTTTRQAVAKLISQGVGEGLSPAELGRRIREATTFNEARADMIARTETAFAQNAATLRTYGGFGVHQVQAIDGDNDPECAARNGSVLPLSEAESITDHPNGTLDWIPVVEAPAKATFDRVGNTEEDIKPSELRAILDAFAARQGSPVTIHLPSELKIPTPEVTVNVPEQQPPVINVAAPIIPPFPDIPPAVVNIPAPAKATLPQEVTVVSLPDRVHKAIRDNSGKITGSVETDG